MNCFAIPIVGHKQVAAMRHFAERGLLGYKQAAAMRQKSDLLTTGLIT